MILRVYLLTLLLSHTVFAAQNEPVFPVPDSDPMVLSITLNDNKIEPLTITLVEEGLIATENEGPLLKDTNTNHLIDSSNFTDIPMIRNISVPDWFQLTFLNLPDDLESAISKDKIGLIVYFGQAHCAYCDALKTVVLARPDIKQYTQRYFDMVAIDVWGELAVTTMDGEKTTELEFANKEKTYFTPSLIFYNAEAKEVLRLRGYYPPYVFRAALDFVVSQSYIDNDFNSYMNQKFNQTRNLNASQDLPKNPIFSPEPYLLNRQIKTAKQPLVVLFEQTECHNCERFHNDILTDQVIYKRLQSLDVVQLNMWADTPVLTPDGNKTTAQAWAKKEGIFFTPSLLFFDEQGQEIIRIDSVIKRIRFNQILKFVLEKGYQKQPIFERWISKQMTVEDEKTD